MTVQKENSYRTLWMLGAVMLVPLILLSGPLAGFLISRFLLINKLNGPEFLEPVCIGLGIAASAIQVYRIIKQIKQSDTQEENNRSNET